MTNFGPVPIGAVLPVFFDSFAGATGASITITGLAVTDIEIYKGTSMTQRASDAGYTLLDTDGIDLDGITGIQGFSIDTGDNTDAGFYAAGSYYNVVVSAITVDSQTVNFLAATFRCVTAEGVAGQPKVDLAAIGGGAQSMTDLKDFADDGYDPSTNKVQGVVLTDTVTTYTGNTVQTGDSFARIGVTGSGLTSLATQASVNTIDDFLDTEIASIITALTTIDDFLDTEIADIQARLPAALVGGRMDASVGAMAANVMTAAAAAADLTTELQSGLATAAALTTIDDFLDTEIAAILAAVDTEIATVVAAVADIQARLPAALTAGGNMKADALAISGSTAAADALEESTEAIGYGTVDGAGATTTAFATSALTPDSSVNDQFNGRVLIFKDDTTTAALRGQATTISDYVHTSAEVGTFTVVALTTAPSTGDTFVIL